MAGTIYERDLDTVATSRASSRHGYTFWENYRINGSCSRRGAQSAIAPAREAAVIHNQEGE